MALANITNTTFNDGGDNEVCRLTPSFPSVTGSRLFPLGNDVFAIVKTYKGVVKLHIRQYYKPDNVKSTRLLPSRKGICLDEKQFHRLCQVKSGIFSDFKSCYADVAVPGDADGGGVIFSNTELNRDNDEDDRENQRWPVQRPRRQQQRQTHHRSQLPQKQHQQQQQPPQDNGDGALDPYWLPMSNVPNME